MADDHDTPANENKPTPRRRPPRKSATKSETASKPAAKRASRPSTAAPKKQAAAKSAPKPADKPRAAKKQESTTDRARTGLDKASDKVGGRRNAGLIAGGLAVGAAAAALFSLRSSTPKKVGDKEKILKAHQPDGTDSSDQMDALIADENMVPETPQG